MQIYKFWKRIFAVLQNAADSSRNYRRIRMKYVYVEGWAVLLATNLSILLVIRIQDFRRNYNNCGIVPVCDLRVLIVVER